jgi:hypothetical protein
MNIQHKSEPFDHTIIYNYYSEAEVNNIFFEKKKLIETCNPLDFIGSNDYHHQQLIKNSKTNSFDLDKIFANNRTNSNILNYTNKIFEIALKDDCFNYKFNRYLKYILSSRRHLTWLNVYKQGSEYESHQDLSVLTVLCVLWESSNDKVQEDNLFFSEFNYVPHLPNNSCIIFPSYEYHEVKKLQCDLDSERISINTRLYI